MSEYGSFSDDFYVNMNLSTELDLPKSRETVLHFFEQIQRRYPTMRNFYNRDRMEYVLEEEKDAGAYRWASLEQRRVNSGYVNPVSIEAALEQHRTVLECAPYALSVSPLDCESLSVMFGFDFTYRGNHNALLHEALGVIPAFEKLHDVPGAGIIGYEPAIQISLDEECKTQARVSFETRTSAFSVRSGEYTEDQLSVYLMVRRYDSLQSGETYADEFNRLAALCRDMVDEYLISSVLRPLQQTIAIK